MLIKLQDFAKECGVTDRAIQKHIQKHEEALKGHFERRGPNGTWLDEYAQEFIRGNMVQPPAPIIGDARTLRENQELRLQVETQTAKLEMQAALLDKFFKENEELQILRGRLKGAEETKKALEESRDFYKADAVEARKEAQTASQELTQKEVELAQLRLKLATAESENKALKERGLWARITRRGE